MFWPMLAAAAVSAAGSYIGGERANSARAQMAQDAQAWEAAQTAEGRAWQEQMAIQGRSWQEQERDIAFEREQGFVNQAERFQREAMANQQDFQLGTLREANAFTRESQLLGQEHADRQQAAAMAFDEQMSNTAYQRAVADMKAAGINPMLAYMKGGASTPSAPAIGGPGGQGASAAGSSAPGAKGSVHAPSGVSAGASPVARGKMAEVENVLGGAANTAFRAADLVSSFHNLSQNIKQSEAQTSLIGAQNLLTAANERQTTANTARIQAETLTELERAGLVRNQSALAAAQRITESFRPNEVASSASRNMAQAGRDMAQMGLTDEQERQLRTYGSGHMGRELGSVSQIIDQIRRSIIDAFSGR